MAQKLDTIIAERRGSKIASLNGGSALPIDPRAIAEKKGIAVEARSLTGCQGCLIRNGDRFGIVYAESLTNEGMIRFTIAHELGHYFLEGHPEALFANGNRVHQSRGGFTSAEPQEREADHFAVGLLMPEELFLREARKLTPGLAAIERLAEKCMTSLTATAIRYASLSEDVVAMVLCEGQKIKYCFASDAIRSLRGISWPGRDTGVPRGTRTDHFVREIANGGTDRRAEGTCDLCDWFDDAPEHPCDEEVVSLSSFGQTITLISSKEPLPDPDDEDVED